MLLQGIVGIVCFHILSILQNLSDFLFQLLTVQVCVSVRVFAWVRGPLTDSPSLCNWSPPFPVKNKNHLSIAWVCPLKMHGEGSLGPLGKKADTWLSPEGHQSVPQWTNGIQRESTERGRMLMVKAKGEQLSSVISETSSILTCSWGPKLSPLRVCQNRMSKLLNVSIGNRSVVAEYKFAVFQYRKFQLSLAVSHQFTFYACIRSLKYFKSRELQWETSLF